MSDSIENSPTVTVPQADPVLALRDRHDARIAGIDEQRRQAYVDFVHDVRNLIAQSPDESLVSVCDKLKMTRQSFYELERRYVGTRA